MTDTYAEHIEKHREERREKLMRIAAEVLAERGVRQTTMDHVAARAGVTKVVLYRYFGAKDRLVHAVLERIVDLILEADAREVDWWTERVNFTLEVARANQNEMKVLCRHAAHDPEFGVHFERLESMLVVRVREQVAVILGDQPDAPVEGPFLAQSVTAMFMESYIRWLELGRPEKDEEFLRWLTRSVRAMSYYWGGATPPEDESAR